jgi:hypothetical protein
MNRRTDFSRGIAYSAPDWAPPLNPSKWAQTARFGESASADSPPVSLRRQGGGAGPLSKPTCLDPLVILYKRIRHLVCLVPQGVLLLARRYDEAISQLRAAIDMDPYFWMAHAALGHAYEEKQRYPEAIEELRKSVVTAVRHFTCRGSQMEKRDVHGPKCFNRAQTVMFRHRRRTRPAQRETRRKSRFPARENAQQRTICAGTRIALVRVAAQL